MGRDHAGNGRSGRVHVWRSDDLKGSRGRQTGTHLAPEPERSSFADGDPRPSATETGIVKWYSDQRGYGFIAPDDGSPDVFVHASAVERAGLPTLEAGQRVRYRLHTRAGQELATAVRLKAEPSG